VRHSAHDQGCPRLLIVLGGPHVSVLPKKAARSPTSTSSCAAEAKKRGSTSRTPGEYLKTSRNITPKRQHPENECSRCLGVTFKTATAAFHQQPDRTRLPTWTALPCRPTIVFKMDRTQPAACHRPRRRRAQLLDHDQPRLFFPSLAPSAARASCDQVAQRSPENVLAEWRTCGRPGAEEIGVLDAAANIRVQSARRVATC